jgi:hypothetical protein
MTVAEFLADDPPSLLLPEVLIISWLAFWFKEVQV